MAQASTKFSIVPPRTEKTPSVLELDSAMTMDADPTRDIRALIEQLQEASSDGRVLLKQAEEERDALATKVGRLQLELDSANEMAKNAREISLARDRLLSQHAVDSETIAELQAKFEACERLRAEASKQRDDLIRQKGGLEKQSAAVLKQSEEAVRQMDALRKSEAEGRAKLEEQRKKMAVLERELGDARKQLSQTDRELEESRKQAAGATKSGGENSKQIAALKLARDGATALVSELKAKVSKLEDQVADLGYERDSLARKASSLAKEPAAASGESARAREAEQRMAETIEALQCTIAAVSKERDELVERNGVLLGAEKQLLAERDAALKTGPASRTPAAIGKDETVASLAEKYESQRIVTIELSAMLENAQREIKEMGASLAEARLLLKSGARRSATAQRTPTQPAARKSKQEPEAEPEPPADDDKIRAMRKSLAAFDRTSNSEPLNELFTNAQSLADEAAAAEARVLHRVASSLAAMLHELYLMPEQVTDSVIQTVDEAIGFLASVHVRENLDQVVNLDTARVYVVDDDQGVCEAVASSIRAVGISAKTTQMPGEALGELACNPYDLPVLDVHLPELSGLELCSHIRTMELHTDTPIIFLSGDASMENRVQSSMRGGNDFLSKPFNFHEMGLKILIRILRAQLSMA